MHNPFEILEQKLIDVEQKLDELLLKVEDPTPSYPTWITTKQLAANLGISTSTVTKLRGSKVPYYRFGGKILF